MIPPAGRSPALRLRHLTIHYGTRPALRDVDLVVPEGEFVALAGPNGSGKTTLIRAVLGLLPSPPGAVELFGNPTETLTVRERARRVAWVPQEETPRDDVPLIDYILYGRNAHLGWLEGESEADRQHAMAILDQMGLGDRAGDGVLSISGGERQRAILARAIAQEAPLLLLDEPTSHLDIGHQLDLLVRVRGLIEGRRVAVIAAMHDLNLAARFADRIVVLSRGRKYQEGTPREVLSEELLARVWGVSADLRQDPRSGVPYLLPHHVLVNRGPAVTRPEGRSVHVVPGGGAAGPYLRALVDEGFRVTVGALHLLDSDTETAERLGLPSAVEIPFAPIGPEVRAHNRQFLDAARVIVVAPFAVGPSNLSNLEDLVPYLARVPILLVAEPPLSKRDFTQGKARELWERLEVAGAVEVSSPEAVVRAIRALPADGPSGAPLSPPPASSGARQR
ncbi:MAG: ABC transporter ATP-binding protein [Thermoplasmata archaeon]